MKFVYLILAYTLLLIGNVKAMDVTLTPESINLKPYCPTPGNQQEENTCVAFVFAHAMTVLQAINHQNKVTTSINAVRFSPDYLYHQIKLKNNKGANYSTAIEFLKQQGNCMAKSFKNKKEYNISPDDPIIKKAQQYRIKSGGMVFENRNTPEQKIDLIKKMLHDSIPVIVNFRAYNSFVQLSKGSLYWPTNTTNQEDNYQDHHALLVIGYDETYFEVMNSWGPEWANNGFVRIPHEALVENSIRGYAISFNSIDSTYLLSMPIKNSKKKATLGVYIPPVVFQKPTQVSVDKTLPEKGNVVLNKAIACSDGTIIAIGAHTNEFDKQQLLFSKVKSNGAEFFTYKGQINKLYNEFGVSAIELTDSMLLLGGYTVPTEKDGDFLKSSIWLNFHQPNGKKIKRRTLKNSPFDLKLEGMEKLDSQLAFVGIEHENLWLMLTDMEGRVILEKTNFLQNAADLAFQSASVYIIDHSIYIYGSIRLLNGKKKGIIPNPSPKEIPYLFKLDKNGNLIKSIKFSDIILEKIGRLTKDKEGQLMMTGTLSQSKKGMYFFLRIPPTLDKELMVLERFGEQGSNVGMDLATLEGGEVLLLGNSKQKGSRTFDVFLNKIDRYGIPKWETPWFHGSKYAEKGMQFLQKKDQSLWICGLKDNGKGFNSNFDFWFLCIKKAGKIRQTVEELNKVEIISAQKEPSFSIDRAAQILLKYTLQNNHASEVVKVKLQAICSDCPSKLDLSKQQQTINIGPGKEYSINLTIDIDKKMKYANNRLTINFSNEADQIIFKENLAVQVVDTEKQPFEVIKVDFTNDSTISKKEETVAFIEIKNKSKRAYKHISLRFEEQEGMIVLGENHFEEDVWKPGEQKKFHLTFIPNKPIDKSPFSMEAFIFYGRNAKQLLLF